MLVVGDIMLDRCTWGNASRVSPEAPVLVLSQSTGDADVPLGENRSAQRANLRPEVGPSWLSVARPPSAFASFVDRFMPTHFLPQIQGGQQMDSIENEREPGNRASQPRVPFSKSSSIRNLNLLASLNLLEIRIMNTTHRPFQSIC